ncbi:MAG: hypothetical protein QM699_03200 [Amaricoccus sp.]|uniref:hypothetical protein n=1 Tax=Amaricoccus sp. TaxID=1872485 RepID=UPI0039E6CF55
MQFATTGTMPAATHAVSGRPWIAPTNYVRKMPARGRHRGEVAAVHRLDDAEHRDKERLDRYGGRRQRMEHDPEAEEDQ